jgi:hypothetical protein
MRKQRHAQALSAHDASAFGEAHPSVVRALAMSAPSFEVEIDTAHGAAEIAAEAPLARGSASAPRVKGALGGECSFRVKPATACAALARP